MNTKKDRPLKLHCALCLHCKSYRVSNDGGRTSVRRLRCDRGQWRSASGRMMTYPYRTLSRRTAAGCRHYLPEKNSEEAEGELLEAILKAAGKE